MRRTISTPRQPLSDESFVRSRREFMLGATVVGVVSAIGCASPRVQPMTRTCLTQSRKRHRECVEDLLLASDGKIVDVIARGHKRASADAWMAALLTASASSISPHPYLGPTFHAPMVLPAAHEIGKCTGGDRDWTSLFWAAAHFDECRARFKAEGGEELRMTVLRTTSSRNAAAELEAALDRWDVHAAEETAVSLINTEPQRAFELLLRASLRDYRDIGHKLIWLAGSGALVRTLGVGVDAALVRSWTHAALRHEEPRDAHYDRPYPRDLEIAARIATLAERPSASSSDLVALENELWLLDENGICERVARAREQGVPVAALWDVLSVAAVELMAKTDGHILGVHCVTSLHALRSANELVKDPSLRAHLLVYAAGRFVAFREYISEKRIAFRDLPPIDVRSASGDMSSDQVFGIEGAERRSAANGFLARGGTITALRHAALQHALRAADGPHALKLPWSLFELASQMETSRAKRALVLGLPFVSGHGNPTSERSAQAQERARGLSSAG